MSDKYGCPNCNGDGCRLCRHINKAAQALGRLGGKTKSAAKSAAARANGKKGGWPKGRKRKPGGLKVDSRPKGKPENL